MPWIGSLKVRFLCIFQSSKKGWKGRGALPPCSQLYDSHRRRKVRRDIVFGRKTDGSDRSESGKLPLLLRQLYNRLTAPYYGESPERRGRTAALLHRLIECKSAMVQRRITMSMNV